MKLPEGLEGDTKEEIINNYLIKHMKSSNQSPSIYAFLYACEKGDLEIAKWIFKSFNFTIKDSRFCDQKNPSIAKMINRMNDQMIDLNAEIDSMNAVIDRMNAEMIVKQKSSMYLLEVGKKVIGLAFLEVLFRDEVSVIITDEMDVCCFIHFRENWPIEAVEYIQEIAQEKFLTIKVTATDLRKIADQYHQKHLDEIVEKLKNCAENGICQLVVDTISDVIKPVLEKTGYKCQTLENSKIRISF